MLSKKQLHVIATKYIADMTLHKDNEDDPKLVIDMLENGANIKDENSNDELDKKLDAAIEAARAQSPNDDLSMELVEWLNDSSNTAADVINTTSEPQQEVHDQKKDKHQNKTSDTYSNFRKTSGIGKDWKALLASVGERTAQIPDSDVSNFTPSATSRGAGNFTNRIASNVTSKAYCEQKSHPTLHSEILMPGATMQNCNQPPIPQRSDQSPMSYMTSSQQGRLKSTASVDLVTSITTRKSRPQHNAVAVHTSTRYSSVIETSLTGTNTMFSAARSMSKIPTGSHKGTPPPQTQTSSLENIVLPPEDYASFVKSCKQAIKQEPLDINYNLVSTLIDLHEKGVRDLTFHSEQHGEASSRNQRRRASQGTKSSKSVNLNHKYSVNYQNLIQKTSENGWLAMKQVTMDHGILNCLDSVPLSPSKVGSYAKSGNLVSPSPPKTAPVSVSAAVNNTKSYSPHYTVPQTNSATPRPRPLISLPSTNPAFPSPYPPSAGKTPSLLGPTASCASPLGTIRSQSHPYARAQPTRHGQAKEPPKVTVSFNICPDITAHNKKPAAEIGQMSQRQKCLLLASETGLDITQNLIDHRCSLDRKRPDYISTVLKVFKSELENALQNCNFFIANNEQIGRFI